MQFLSYPQSYPHFNNLSLFNVLKMHCCILSLTRKPRPGLKNIERMKEQQDFPTTQHAPFYSFS